MTCDLDKSVLCIQKFKPISEPTTDMDKIDDTLSNAVNHNSPVTKNCSSNLKSFS